MTPMMRVDARSIWTTRPMTDESEPNCDVQSACEITATSHCPDDDSPSVNPRPSAGRTPSVWKKFVETRAASSWRGSPLPVIATPHPGLNAATVSKVFECDCMYSSSAFEIVRAGQIDA